MNSTQMLPAAVQIALYFAFACVGLALVLVAWRLWRGPEVTDRILALDTLYINAVALVFLLGMMWSTPWLFEAALIIAMLGFVGTVGLARFVTRGDVVE